MTHENHKPYIKLTYRAIFFYNMLKTSMKWIAQKFELLVIENHFILAFEGIHTNVTFVPMYITITILRPIQIDHSYKHKVNYFFNKHHCRCNI